jgi:hypothetical protein
MSEPSVTHSGTSRPAADAGDARASFEQSARHLREHPAATWVELLDLGLLESEVLLAPERVLNFPVDGSRRDLVEEFRRRPLGPHGVDLTQLLWQMRSQTPHGRYVARELAGGGWQVIRLTVGRRPRWEPVPEAKYDSREELEWGIFALRWRDQTGQELPLAWERS